MIWKIALGLWMFLVISAAFLYAPAALGLGELSRIIFFHVPLAWVGVLAYLVAMVYGIRYLKYGRMRDDRMSVFNAEVGFAFTILATITGAIFARHTWGMYWNWDPRQTSIFILLLIYGAFFLLRSAIDDEERRARLASVYSILAFISVPFLVFVIPRIYMSLHPDPIINVEASLNMDSRMFQVFMASLLGFTGIYLWLNQLHSRLERLREKIKGEGMDRA